MTNSKIKAVATLANAQEHARLEDKFIFCLDLLDLSINDRFAETLVNELEDAFDVLLTPTCAEIVAAANSHIAFLRGNGSDAKADGLAIILTRITAHKMGIRDITKN
jgi:hypothetical protein